MGGGSGTYEDLVQAPQHAKTEETVSHHQNNNVKEVGTPPVPSNLCTPLTAVSTGARAEQSHKDSVRKATAEEQLSSKTVNPSNYDSPALDLSWALNALFTDNSKTIHPALRAQLHLPLDLSWPGLCRKTMEYRDN